LQQPSSPATTLRIALVGAGKMAQHHARAIQRLGPSATLAAVAEPSDAAAAAMREVAPEIAVYDSLEALIAAGAADVVHICTPPTTHAALASRAIAAGLHVYVEKPFVEHASEAERLLAQAAECGVKVCAGHQLLFEPPALEARRLRPALGKLVHVESYFSFRTVRRAPGGRAPLRADLQLLDILPHPVYLLLRFLEDEPGETELAALSVSPAGTVHALVRRGEITGTLIVTLEGRPVDSYLRVVGTNGAVHADFVRSTVQRNLGPGISGIDKVFAPYRQARQLLFGTTGALARRVLKRQRSYPGLAELFSAFYDSIRGQGESPVPPVNILGTTRICEAVAGALEEAQARLRSCSSVAPDGPLVVLTGGTGFLGKATARSLLAQGRRVRVLARRVPAAWEEVRGVEYAVADLGGGVSPDLVRGAELIIHAAAETAGGWEDHQRNSLDATANVLAAAHAAGVSRVIHVSSSAVQAQIGGPINEDSPLEPKERGSGPYVWGKLASERLAVEKGRELGLDVKVVRPAAIIDAKDFDPPGRLGKRLGNVFVAVGYPWHRLGVVDLDFAASTLAWMVRHWDEAPGVLNLYDPELPTKRDLLARLKATNPDISVVWLWPPVLHPLSWFAILLQKVLRPSRPAINVAKVFSVPRYDTSRIAALAPRVRAG
jgi:predicted dehydrogenase/nucleoside-diphosphate-sugar epimerase